MLEAVVIIVIFQTTLEPSFHWIQKPMRGDALVAQSVQCPNLDLGSGHDPRVVRSSPMQDSVLKILSPSPSMSPQAHACSLKQNKTKQIYEAAGKVFLPSTGGVRETQRSLRPAAVTGS